MKEFIYLDTAFLHSFIAQTNSGLPSLINTEIQEVQIKSTTTTSTDENATEINGEINTGQFNVPGIFSTPSAKGSLKVGTKAGDAEAISLSQTDAGKEIITKHLHDNALSEFEKYLIDGDLLITKQGNEQATVGEYISLSGNFSIVDLQFIQNALKPNTITEFIAFSAKDTIKKQFAQQDQSNHKVREAFRKALKEVDESKKQYQEQFAFVESAINYIVDLMATKSYIRVGKYIAPLKTDFLRDTPRELTFKYGNTSSLEITVIGRVTRIYDSFISANITDQDSVFKALGAVSGLLEQFLGDIKLIAKDDIILSPVAIYFE